jgi:hypothetical protein
MKELSLNILDLAQNSIKANASHLEILLTREGSWLTIQISDDGTGMSPAFAAQAANPFTTTRTTRTVGMGLPLFKMAAEQTGGTFSLVSQQAQQAGEEHGTTVRATFDTAHVDCEPLGNLVETILTLIQGNPDLSLTYIYRTEAGEQRLSTDEMREVLGDEVPLNSPDVLAWAREYLQGTQI